MKHLRFLNIVFCAVMILFSSCKDNDATLSVSTTQLEFDYSGGEQTVTIGSDDDWSIYGLPDWLVASRLSGVNTQEVTLTAARNTTGLDREQMLSIRSNNSSNIQTIKVKQYANSVGQVFSVDNTSMKYFSGTTSVKEDSIVLNSSVRWRITGPSWLTMNFNGDISRMTGEIREGSGTIYLRCSASYSGEETRKDVITLQTEYGDETIRIPVEQMGLYDVKCVNMHVLSDGLWFNYKYGQNTEYITTGYYEGVVSPEEKSGIVWGNQLGKNATVSIYNLSPNTYYTIMMRAMPSETLVYKKVNAELVRTPSEENQPRAEICDVIQNVDGGWNFRIAMNEYAKGYYRVTFTNTNADKIAYARNMYNAIESGDGNVVYNNKDATYSRTRGDGTIVAWAVGKDGSLSKVIDIYKIISSSSSLAPVWQIQSGKEHLDLESIDEAKIEIIK